MYLEYHGVIAVSEVKQDDVDGLYMNAKVCCNSMNIISTHPTGEIFQTDFSYMLNQLTNK